MKFKATEEQLLQIGTNAVRASSPMGYGFLHFKPTDDDSFQLSKTDPSHDSGLGARALTDRGLYLDYVNGRMVKLNIRALGDGVFDINDDPRSDYQSWVRTYPTAGDLLKSVPGVEIL